MKTIDEKLWHRRRMMFAGLKAIIFACIAFYFGPNLILFHKLTWLTPADFVPLVTQKGIPVVTAMLEYQRTYKKLPESIKDLSPNLPKGAIIHHGQFFLFCSPHNLVTYNFTTDREGWWVGGAFASGRIPLPTVVIGPTTRDSSTP